MCLAQSIHEHLFKGAFEGALKDYAGKFRDYNITKNEPILNNDTVTYGNYENLLDYLKYDFEEEKAVDYAKHSLSKQIERLQRFTSAIWQVQAFGEGNTRTTAVFIEKYLKSKGWNVNNDMFANYAVYFRNALVLSNYANMSKGIAPTFEYLNAFFHKLLVDKKYILSEMKPVEATEKENSIID